MVCHCVLVETDRGLVLIDSGIGLEDIARPAERLGRMFVTMVGAELNPEQTAVRQIERLGFSRRDVRHIILTHLDLDHAGGLSDFPEAKVHVARAEYDVAFQPKGRDRQRYRPLQWAHGPDWGPLRHPWRALERFRVRARPRGTAAGVPARSAGGAQPGSFRRRGGHRKGMAAPRGRCLLLPRRGPAGRFPTARPDCDSSSGWSRRTPRPGCGTSSGYASWYGTTPTSGCSAPTMRPSFSGVSPRPAPPPSRADWTPPEAPEHRGLLRSRAMHAPHLRVAALTAFALLTSATGWPIPPGDPRVIAHRSAAGYWPENSRTAITGARRPDTPASRSTSC